MHPSSSSRPASSAACRTAGAVATAAATLLLCASDVVAQEHQHGEPRHGMEHDHAPASLELRDDLGDHTHPVTAADDTVQAWFDQGVRLTYAFDHAAAVRSFREAARRDPGCAMCWWGMAWASGPNINAAMDSASGAAAYEAIRRAVAELDDETERERAYVEAMAERYGPDPTARRAMRDSAYARAMNEVADRWPEDDDARVLAGESLMLLSPWDYWTAEDQPKPGTERLLEHLRTVTERDREHAGACHFYIHAVEAAYPERALPCAGRIADLMPGAGHVVHMPGHVYIRTGRYADAVEANRRAIAADERAGVLERDYESAYALGYHPHNYHFLSYAAAMAGQSEVALKAARQLAEMVDRDALRVPAHGYLQHFLVTPIRVMVRFGMWERVLEEPAPPEDLAYPTGTWRYARAMAYARTGRVAEAEAELARLRELAATPGLDELRFFDLNSAAALLGVAERIVTGEIAAARGDHGAAIAALEEGIERESALTYDEPPPWHLPVRHVLGAVLLEADRPADAEPVYRRALKRFPENGYALIGLARSLEAQGKEAEAAEVRERLAAAWAEADVELSGSRF